MRTRAWIHDIDIIFNPECVMSLLLNLFAQMTNVLF